MADNFRKLNIHFDIEAIKEAYRVAVEDIGFSGDLVNCISLTHTDKDDSDPRGIFWTLDSDYREIQVERHVNEEAYRIFEPLLMDTYFKNVYDTLSKHYKLGRVRLLLKEPRSTLSWHRDPEPRLHIPIVTNPGCIMVIENIAKHLPADGSAYITNNLKYHNAFNGGEENRVHLVACLLDYKFQ